MSSNTVPAFCHACNETFLIPAARSDPESLRCRHCGSDFVELLEDRTVDSRALRRQLLHRRHLFSELSRSSTRGPEETLIMLPEPRASLRLLPTGTDDAIHDLPSMFDLPSFHVHGSRAVHDRRGSGLGTDLGRLFQHMAQQHQPPSTPASNEALRRLRREKLQSGGSQGGELVNEYCAVCREQYKEGDNVVHLPCDHVFHEGCVMPWFEEHNTCPVCRFELPVESSSTSRGTASSTRALRRPRRNQVAQELMHHHRDVTSGDPVIDSSFLDMFRPATDGDHHQQRQQPAQRHQQFRHSRPRPSPQQQQQQQQQQFDHGSVEVTGGNGSYFLNESIRSAQGQLRSLEECLTEHLSERRRLQDRIAQLHDNRQSIRDQLIAAQNQNLEAASAIASITQQQQQQQSRQRRHSNDPGQSSVSRWLFNMIRNGGGDHASPRNSHDMGNSPNFSDSNSGSYC